MSGMAARAAVCAASSDANSVNRRHTTAKLPLLRENQWIASAASVPLGPPLGECDWLAGRRRGGAGGMLCVVGCTRRYVAQLADKAASFHLHRRGPADAERLVY